MSKCKLGVIGHHIAAILLLIACAPHVVGSSSDSGSNGTVSDEANVRQLRGDAVFNSTLASTPLVFVKFFHPGCPHCQAIAPVYATAASSGVLRSESDVLRFAAVDISIKANNGLFQTHSGDGVPTLKLYKKGALYATYDGVREKAAMVSWLRRLVARYKAPAVTFLRTRDERDEFLRKWAGTCVVLAYLPRGQGDEAASPDVYAAIADAARPTLGTAPMFATVSDVNLLGGVVRIAYSTYAREPRVVVLRNASTEFENPVWWTPGVWGMGDMRSFITASTAPRDGSALLTAELASALVNEPAVLYAFGDRSTPDDVSADALRKLARTASDRALVVYVYDQKWRGLMRHLGVNDTRDEDSPLPQALRFALCRLGTKESDKVVYNNTGVESVRIWLDRALKGHGITHRGLAGVMNRFNDHAWHAVVEHENRILVLVVCGNRALIKAECEPIQSQVKRLRNFAHAVHIENFDGREPPSMIHGAPFKLPQQTQSKMNKPFIAVIPPGEKPRILEDPEQIVPVVLSVLDERAPAGSHTIIPIAHTNALHLHVTIVGGVLLALGCLLSLAMFTPKSHRTRTTSDKSV